jgi:hypothetical protein
MPLISRKSFQGAPHDRRFIPVLDDSKAPTKQVMDERILGGMGFIIDGFAVYPVC